jgi:phospholipase C
VIYAENRSFDHLYGLFPGANGLANATPDQYIQVDRDGKPLPHLPPGVEGEGADPGLSHRLAEQAVPHRRAAREHVAAVADARHDPQVLSAAGADQRRTQRPLRRGVRFRRAADGYYDGSSLPMWKLAQE